MGRPGLEPGTNALKGQFFTREVPPRCYFIAFFGGFQVRKLSARRNTLQGGHATVHGPSGHIHARTCLRLFGLAKIHNPPRTRDILHDGVEHRPKLILTSKRAVWDDALADAPDLGISNHRFQNIPFRFKKQLFYERKSRVFHEIGLITNGE